MQPDPRRAVALAAQNIAASSRPTAMVAATRTFRSSKAARMTGFLGQAIRHTSHSGRDCLDNSKRGPPVSYERTWLRVRVTPALSLPPSPAHIAVMAKSHKPPRDPTKHSKSDPARPTRAKAARPEAPPAEPALDRLLNPGIETRHRRHGLGHRAAAAAGQFVRPPRRFLRRAPRAQVDAEGRQPGFASAPQTGYHAPDASRRRRSTSTPSCARRWASTAIRRSR